jgi:parallel beta-helix repeat protein
MRSQSPVSLALAIVLLSPFAGLALPKQAKPEACPDQRYLVQGSPVMTGDASPESIVISHRRISLGSACPVTHVRLRATKRGTRVKATWPSCKGVRGRTRLTATIGQTCETMSGTFESIRSRAKANFSANHSICGDGVVDRGAGEQCDSGAGCQADQRCDNTVCTCSPGVVTPPPPPPPPPINALHVDQANPKCTDGGPGSVGQPFCTIAAGASAVAGQTVVVASGTYMEDVTPTKSGSLGAPIVFTAAPGAAVTITGETNGFTISAKSWITVQGFNITRTTGDGVSVAGSSNITILGNHVSYCGQPTPGRIARGIRLSATFNSVVANNTVDHNSDHGIFLTNSSMNVTVIGNQTSFNARVFDDAASGIHLEGSTGNVIDSNVSHDNENSGIDFAQEAADNLVRNNNSYRNGDHGIDVLASPGQRIIGNSAYNNATAGINVEGSSSGATLFNNISVDNGIHSPAATGNIRVDSTSIAGTTVDYDLVFLNPSGTTMMIWGHTAYSSLAAFVAATGQETHGIQADPHWNAPDSGDMHLTEGSRAIDSANSAAPGQTSIDADGKPRVDDPATPNTGAGPRRYDDRGAYEFQPPGGP